MKNVARFALFATAMAGAVWAARPQMVWRGELEGPVQLRISGDRVDAQGAPFAAQDYRFTEPLPPLRQDVQALVRQGRADVRVIEDPRPNNNYTALVEVRPRGRGRERVAVEFYWREDVAARDRRDRGWGEADRVRPGRAGAGQVVWSGRVDHEALVEIRDRRADVRTLSGQPVYGQRADFSGALPRRDMAVRLVDARGRGRISIAEHPSARNGYTARIHILDPDGGAGDYSFVLDWDDAYGGYQQPAYQGPYQQEPYFNQGPYFGSSSGEMRWTGRVDGHIRVIVQGNRARVERVSGGPVQGARASFSTPFDGRNAGNVNIRRVHGRDEVRIVEQPSPQNGYRLVFEIDDNDGGADDYEDQLTW
jgi:hypothetical protein